MLWPVVASALLSAYLFKRKASVYYFKILISYAALAILCCNTVFFAFNLLWRPYALRFANCSFKLLAWLVGLRVTVRGGERLREHDTAVVLSNHQHDLDFMCISYLSDYLGAYVSLVKREILFRTLSVGLHCWLSGSIFVERAHTEKARKTMNEVPAYLLKNKLKLHGYPEGTRRKTAEIHPFKKGLFHVAIQAQIPIIPAVISHFYFVDPSEPRYDNGNAIVSVLPPVPTKGLTADDVDSLVARVHSMMQEEFTKISAEVRPVST